MSLSSVPYYFATCAGKNANLRTPRCTIEGPGSFDETEAMSLAVDDGWVFPGRGGYCPAHTAQAPAADSAEPPVKRQRRNKSAGPDTPADVQITLENQG